MGVWEKGNEAGGKVRGGGARGRCLALPYFVLTPFAFFFFLLLLLFQNPHLFICFTSSLSSYVSSCLFSPPPHFLFFLLLFLFLPLLLIFLLLLLLLLPFLLLLLLLLFLLLFLLPSSSPAHRCLCIRMCMCWLLTSALRLSVMQAQRHFFHKSVRMNGPTPRRKREGRMKDR